MENIGQVRCSVATCNTIFVQQQENAATVRTLTPSFFNQIAVFRGQRYKGKFLLIGSCSGAIATMVPEISSAKVGVTKVHF